jgi:adenosylhomocysteine nucleosidase
MFVVACGLKREAKLIARGGNVLTVAGGGDSARLERELDDIANMFPGVIVSSGLAGALDSALNPGDIVIDGDPRFVARVRSVLPEAIAGKVAGVDAVAATVARKRVLREVTGAIACDMESHIAERVARKRGRPFGVIRVISDGAETTLPPAALVGMRPDGGIALGAVLASLARDPRQLTALLRTGRQADRAFRELGRLFDVLGRAGICGLDPGEFALHV